LVRGVILAVAAIFLLACAGVASAASPQKIYRDLADNGRLDGHYSKGDINRALHMPSLQRYEVNRKPAAHRSAPLTASSSERSRAIPFTGLDLALFGVVGGLLLILGAGLGRIVRPREQELRS
jgi:hypothetical protein